MPAPSSRTFKNLRTNCRNYFLQQNDTNFWLAKEIDRNQNVNRILMMHSLFAFDNILIIKIVMKYEAQYYHSKIRKQTQMSN